MHWQRTDICRFLKSLFNEVLIPPAVLKELQINDNRPGSKVLNKVINDEKWIKLRNVSVSNSRLILTLDQGEI